MHALLTLDSFPSTAPFTLENPEVIARQLQHLTMENRETDDAGGYTVLMESLVETPSCKEYCVQKHTHEAKINSSFINLLYAICLLISTI